MTYRKIVVNGKNIQYVIGKTHTKVRGGATALNKDIGIEVVDEAGVVYNHLVTPQMVAKWLRGDTKKPVFDCEHGTTTQLTVNPFDCEVSQKVLYIPACNTCLDRLAGDI